ncbi:DUF3631 domain-containing protein [Dietzia cinnamea]|uniref:DUF3631 domain-containing protein n=2 Tax=Dietzia cinnamea TaxID=321318 RepID=UPI00223B884D|nr:DUF3631 domain-containing protein [Dietzia cinnamea]MCT2220616.1 DUF3631 domain-containing protein [Dietzia cinnamea]
MRQWLARYIRTTTEADLDLLTLWAVHTHLVTELYTTPRLLIDSVMPGSGKTTCLDHLSRLCAAPIQAASLSSPALLARILANGPRTILIDEADRSLDPKKEGVGELLAILNSGYRAGAARPVLTPTKGGGWDVDEMPTHAPVAMAGNSPALPEDSLSRCARVLLMPDLDGTAEESDWELIEDDALNLAERITGWCDSIRDEVRAVRPPLPEGIKGRARERWLPLKRVAVMAGGRWPAAVDALSTAEADRLAVEAEDGLMRKQRHMILVEHLADVWPEGESFVPTSQLLDVLKREHPDEWGEFARFGRPLTSQAMGRMIAGKFGVHTCRPDTNGPRGYLLADLDPVLRRLGLGAPDEPDEPAEPAQPDKPAEPDEVAEQGRCRVCGQSILVPDGSGICARRDPEHDFARGA